MRSFKVRIKRFVLFIPGSYTGCFNYKWMLTGAFLLNLCIANAQKENSQLLNSDTSSAIEEKLVQLALAGPEAKKLEHQNKINDYQLKSAQNQWLNLLALSANYNDQSFTKTPTTNYVYPKYYFGITVPLGTILSKTAVKSARESIEIGKNDQEILRRTIREQVIMSYKQYKAYMDLISIQGELVNDVQAELVQAEEKFKRGTITIEAYNTAQKSNNAELAALINLKLQRDLKKLEIEKMIGVKLELVLNSK